MLIVPAPVAVGKAQYQYTYYWFLAETPAPGKMLCDYVLPFRGVHNTEKKPLPEVISKHLKS